MSDLKDMINVMFYHVCRRHVLVNKCSNSIDEKLLAWLNAQRACELYTQLKLVLYRAYVLKSITETEYKFVLRALESAVYG